MSTRSHLCRYRAISGTNLRACVIRGCDRAKMGPDKPPKNRTIRRYGKSDISQCKQRIQALLREICLIRDRECILANVPGYICSGRRKDGGLVLQADHLESRGNPRTYAESKAVVLVCRGHHNWKTKYQKELYDRLVRQEIGEERWLWIQEKAKSDKYPKLLSEWLKAEQDLLDELENLMKA